jgi:hypothetical protein
VKNKIAMARIIVDTVVGIVIVKGKPSNDPITSPDENKINILLFTFL